jgi:hypothetical protein
VVQALGDGADARDVIAHYRTRLLAGFRKHLEACCAFYQTGYRGPWWEQQIAKLRRGLKWTGHRLQAAGAFRHGLNGFRLEALW